jgi:AcrR family transcriptional regulator
MSDLALSRRDRKRLTNRESIRSAAVRLFMDRGFDNVSVDDVADAADVSPSTVYRNFPTKEDLVLANMAERQREFVRILDDEEGPVTTGGLLLAATLAWAPTGEQQRLLSEEAALIVATPALLARLHQMMADWEVPISQRLARRCARPSTDLALLQLTASYCATIRIVIREWAVGDAGVDIVDFGRQAVEALEHLPAAQLLIT